MAWTKYRNKKVTTEDGCFDSKKELKRWNELKLLEMAGEISQLTRDKSACTFDLTVNGQRVCKYVADAVYYEGGKMIVEDTKSPVTRANPVYRIKKKLLKALRNVEIREV